MQQYEIVYVTGHKNPDSDSVLSSIAYAYLKQQLNVNACACCLGDLNDETNYILERFQISKPLLLKDARSQLDEIDMDTPVCISPETTIYEALKVMNDENKPVLAVVNNLNQLKGIITARNLSDVLMGDTARSIELLSKTPIEYISKTINGKLIYAPEKPRHNGKVSIPALSTARLEHYELADRIVIVGNDTNAQLECIEKDAALIIIVWASMVAPMVIQRAKEKGCGIVISGHGTMNTSRYLFYASPIKDLMSTDLVVFNKAEFVEDVTNKMIRSRFRSYPVVDDHNHIFGFVSRYHLLNAKNKQLILVDHNETRQSVHGIEHADILEIIDHHRIGDISTSKPITFRNEIVGSTATIITKMFNESHVEIPPKMASILLAAMISDTLNFRSPTTTPIDIKLSKQLSEIAELDINQFAHDIFSVSSSLKNKSISELLTYDLKEFVLASKRVTISQFIMYQLNELVSIEKDIHETLDQFAKEHKADLSLLVFTSIHDNGSVIYGGGKLADIVPLAFPNKPNESHSFLAGIVSRKNQIVPQLSRAINQNNG